MTRYSRFALPVLALMLALAGCGKQEAPPSPSPSPTPTPTPPPKATYCEPDGDTCKVKAKEVVAQQGKPGHTCDSFDDNSAIHYSLSTGKFNSIKVVKNADTDPDFTVTITPCGDAPADPFSKMPPKNPVKEWASGKKNKKYKDSQLVGKHYTMMVTEKGAAQGGDPHIVIDQRGTQ